MTVLERKTDISLPLSPLIIDVRHDRVQSYIPKGERKDGDTESQHLGLCATEEQTCQENQDFPGGSASITTQNARKRGVGTQE